jgi:hypothetical protein
MDLRAGSLLKKVGLAALAALLLAAAETAQAAPPAAADECFIDAAKVANPPRFADFPTKRLALKPAAPLMNTPGARLFRTELRRQAKQGPNFAGAFTIATWGCGSACLSFAILDARTGRDDIDTGFAGIGTNHAKGFKGLDFRPDSRLLIITGEPDDPDTGAVDSGGRAGVYYAVLTRRKLKVIRFVSRGLVCSPAEAEERP